MATPAGQTVPLLPDATPLRVVLDTNVVMALWHFDDPQLAALKTWAEGDDVRLLANPASLGELQRVLAYRQFAIPPERQAALLADYAVRVSTLPEPDDIQLTALTSLPRCGDRDDQKFIELAVYGQAHVLVSRDKLVLKLARRRELRDQLLILTPERLQRALSQTARGVQSGHIA